MNSQWLETILPKCQRLQLIQGDITVEATDAIVNAANAWLQHGAGVAGAILRRGGPVIQKESDVWVIEHRPVKHAKPAWTSSGSLDCRVVIHAVGPIWDGSASSGEADGKLAQAILGSLQLADELELHSIAFPAISTGIFGFPKLRAAQVMFRSFRKYFEQPTGLTLVRVVLYDDPTKTAFEKAWHDYFDPKLQA